MATPSFSYMAHLSGTGDTEWRKSPGMLGTTGEVRGMQSLKFRIDSGKFGIRGKCRLSDEGYLDWVNENEWIGQPAKGHHLESIFLEITGDLKATYDIFYRAHFSGGGWSKTVSNGSELGSAGNRIEAVEIFILPKA